MKKSLFVLLTLLLIIGSFVACAQAPAAEEYASNPNEAPTPELTQMVEEATAIYPSILDEDLGVLSEDLRVLYMSASLHTALAILEDGSLWMWESFYRRDEESGEWISPDWQDPPVLVMDNIVHAAAGPQHHFAIDEDGTLWGWGENNEWNILGDGTDEPRPYPVRIMEDVAYVTISPVAPNSHVGDGIRSYAITNDGTLYGWGANGQMEWNVALGDGGDVPQNVPVRIMDGVSTVTPTRDGGYATAQDGTVWWWGARHGWGESSLEAESNPNDYFWQETRLSPVQVDSSDYVKNGWKPQSEMNFSYNIDENGTLWTWGENQLPYFWSYMPLVGDGTNEPRAEPVRIMDHVQSVTVLADTIFVIDWENTLWAWGVNHLGQIGDGTTQLRLSPVQIMENVAEISAHYMMDHGGVGFMNTFVLSQDGELWRIGSLRGHGSPYPLEYRGVSGVLPVLLYPSSDAIE